MPNIKFSYFYRDGGNYKKFDSVVFANPDNIGLSEIENLIRTKLIDNTWFYADAWGMPELFLETFHWRVDPTWHEYEAVEYTEDDPNLPITLSEFLANVTSTKLPW